MTANALLLIVMGVMYAGGIYLLLERTLTRVLLGMMLITNATNVLILVMSGTPGRAPIVTDGVDPSEYSDPLPQALTLTAIVISFAVTAFMLGMIYRSWKLGRRDEVQVDTEDVKVAEQPSFDAEDDAELQDESSEFLDEDEDPNADYEHATALNPATGTLTVRHQKDGTVAVTTHTGEHHPERDDSGHHPEEDERPGNPQWRPGPGRTDADDADQQKGDRQ